MGSIRPSKLHCSLPQLLSSWSRCITLPSLPKKHVRWAFAASVPSLILSAWSRELRLYWEINPTSRTNAGRPQRLPKFPGLAHFVLVFFLFHFLRSLWMFLQFVEALGKMVE